MITLNELRKEAIEAKQQGKSVILWIKIGKYPRRFPRGALLEEGEDYRVYAFDPDKIIAYVDRILNKNGS